MLNQFGDGVVVADNNPVEPKLSPQIIAQQGNMRGHRNAGHAVERRHDRGAAGRDRGPKWRQVNFVKGAFGKVDGRIFAPSGGGAARAEMLGGRGD